MLKMSWDSCINYQIESTYITGKGKGGGGWIVEIEENVGVAYIQQWIVLKRQHWEYELIHNS